MVRKTMALKKQVKASVYHWHSIYGVDYCELALNGVLIGKLTNKARDNLASAFGTHFEGNSRYDLIADTIKVDKGNLLINGVFVCELDYKGLYMVNGAFSPITKYHILVNLDNLSWTYSFSQDWHIQNLSSIVEEIETKDCVKTIKQLKEKYAPMVKHNSCYAFEVIEYRGEDFNRTIMRDNVGLVPDNFDEEIRKQIFK